MMRTKLKKWGLAAALFLLMSLVCLSFAACGTKTEKFDVTFYDGSKVITTKSVEKGGKVAAFVPADVKYTKEGFTFADWFATADYTQAWSFDRTIEKNTNVYSQWVSSQTDTRPWQIAGSSAVGGPLKDIGWNGGPSKGGGLIKTEGKNEFTLTIDLYIGDQFQLCVQDKEGVWVNDTDGAVTARGGQYLVKNEYMAAASGGLGDGQKNIVVSVAGNYTLTLTTDALDKNYGKITVKRNGEAPEVKVERKAFTWYIYGNAGKGQEADSVLKDMNWGNGYDEEAGLTNPAPYAMKKTSDNTPDGTGTWLMTAKFDVGDEFLFAYLLPNGKRLAAEEGTLFKYDSITEFNGTDAAFEGKGGNNIAVKTAGTYTFELTVSLDEASQTLKATIEVWDNADILTSEREWAVFGNRMKYEEVTGTADGLPGLTLTQDEYNNYTSDLEGNDFGKGENVKMLTKTAAPAEGAAISYEVTLKLGVGDYFYFCIPIWVHEVSRPDAYTTGGYDSTVMPTMASPALPEGIGAAWKRNFLCTKAGNYKFVMSVKADGTITVAVTAAA